jgi:hypothetical protein
MSAEERACCWRVASNAWLGKGADEDSLGRQAQCAPDCRRQLNQNEIVYGIQIIFTGLVNDPNVLSLSGGGIGQDLIDFSNFQGSRVTLVADTDCKLWFGGNLGAAHRCLFHYALDPEFLLTQAAGFIPMDLGPEQPAIWHPHCSKPFAFSPASRPVDFSQAPNLADGAGDFPDDLKMHARIYTKNPLPKQAAHRAS